MAVIGILTCQIFELEWAELLSADSDIEQITIIENEKSKKLADALEKKGLTNINRIPHLNSFKPEPSEQLQLLIRVFDFSLHRNRKLLARTLHKEAQPMQCYVDCFLLGYGLCGNTLLDPSDVLDTDKPIFIANDPSGGTVDDCIGLLIGGRECYHAELCKQAGTFFMTAGWVNHWDKILNPKYSKVDTPMAQRMFKRYKRTLLVNSPVMPQQEMENGVNHFNNLFACQSENKMGNLTIFKDTWNRAKQSLVKK